MNTLNTIALLLGYGILAGIAFMVVLLIPSTYKYLRDDLQNEWLFWTQRHVARWYRAKRDQVLGFLVVLLGLGLVWLGLIISAPAQ